ncbi:MAG: ferrous iron transport protein A [Clostridiales bacterium]|nr:ferrous iron transport protein A [Clostridiales bacterium]
MKQKKMSLNDLPLNTCGMVYNINCNCNIYRRLLDLGIVKNTKIVPVLKSPSGDPRAYEVRGTLIALRYEDAQNIEVII